MPSLGHTLAAPTGGWDKPGAAGLPTRIGDYQVLGLLGSGGMGTVYEARQPVIGKRAALKVLHPQVLQSTELVERFLGEARAVNEIRHRGVVDIFGFGTLADRRHYLVMELLEGHSMEHELAQGPLCVTDALLWTSQVLEVLDCAHSAGVVHRDLKPSNLFLVEGHRGQRYLKLLDFGIAKRMPMTGRATLETQGAMVLGTPDYMSPEQVRSEPVTGRTDLYSLGCVLFELLTGQRPFNGETYFDVMFMQVESPAPRAGDLVDGVPDDVEALLASLLEKDPARRPPTAEAALEGVMKLLERHTAGEDDSRPTRLVSAFAPRAVPTQVLPRVSLEQQLFADLEPAVDLVELADEESEAIAERWLEPPVAAPLDRVRRPAPSRLKWGLVVAVTVAAAATLPWWSGPVLAAARQLVEWVSNAR